MDGDDSTRTQTAPEHVMQLVYGRLGFSAMHTAVLSYRAPYVLLATASRPRDPYSVVSLDTGRTVERFTDAHAASTRLDELVREAS